MHVDAAVADEVPQQGAAAAVDLHGHEPVVAFHDVRDQAEQAQRVGGLDAQQPAADHHAVRARPGPLGGRADRVEVVERAVDVAAGQVVAGDGRDERARAGRQDQGVVVDVLAGVELHAPGGGVDRGDEPAGPHGDAGVGGVPRVVEVQGVALPRADVGGQSDAVVGGIGFLADHRDGHVGVGVPRAEGGDEAVGDHPVPDDDDVLSHSWTSLACLCGSG